MSARRPGAGRDLAAPTWGIRRFFHNVDLIQLGVGQGLPRSAGPVNLDGLHFIHPAQPEKNPAVVGRQVAAGSLRHGMLGRPVRGGEYDAGADSVAIAAASLELQSDPVIL